MTAVEIITSEMEKKAISPRMKTKSIVVATDGSESALAAFNAANLIQNRDGGFVHVVSVLEPMPVPAMFPSAEGIILPVEFDKSREDWQRSTVRDQLNRYDAEGRWTLDLRVGRAAETIVRFAHEKKADLVIVGANKHTVVGRVFGEETAMEIARLSDVPLLVASSDFKRLPKRVVVAMDLNSEGMQCCPQALEILVDAPSISCVHVKPRSEFLGIDWAEFDSEYDLVMRERFAELEKDLLAAHIRPDLVVLHGDTAHELTEYADFSKAELIVVGVKRRRGRARAVGGRMAGRVVRAAKCSVLLLPNEMSAESTAPAQGTTDVLNDRRMWGDALRDFTARNAGRTASLEVDDPEFGALVEASRYPFRGVDYDHKDGRLTITLGSIHGVDRHLTRTISSPTSVSVLTIKGRDTALAVTHGGGQTLLTF
jgi:nucleotide-binding universal stress UspA family protein